MTIKTSSPSSVCQLPACQFVVVVNDKYSRSTYLADVAEGYSLKEAIEQISQALNNLEEEKQWKVGKRNTLPACPAVQSACYLDSIEFVVD